MTRKTAIQATPKEVRRFGILFAVICSIVALYLVWKENQLLPYFVGGGGFFLLAGFFGHSILRPIYIGWMRFAFVLGWINTRILLGVFFYLVLTPIGLVLRLTGKDLLSLKIDRTATSYWIKRERKAYDPERAKQQF
ncbi:MAG: conserved rane protein of unknown function [Bacteroidetes bacterium]|nr:conserved rane protein of unknown function [Bacteroidota bacterium]